MTSTCLRATRPVMANVVLALPALFSVAARCIAAPVIGSPVPAPSTLAADVPATVVVTTHVLVTPGDPTCLG